MKNPPTPAGIEPATLRFVVQHFDHCATVVPREDTVVGANTVCLSLPCRKQACRASTDDVSTGPAITWRIKRSLNHTLLWTRAAQIVGTWPPRLLNFVRWCLIFSTHSFWFFLSLYIKMCTRPHIPSREHQITTTLTGHSRTAGPKKLA